MSETFTKLKELLVSQNKLSAEDITHIETAHGALTDDERVELEAERHRVERSQDETVTMDQYLAALKILDSVPEGSDEYNKADALVQKYERGN
jgi:hypothetical protein